MTGSQQDGQRPVLVVAASREDRRVLFDILDRMDCGEILSARTAVHAHALLERSTRPALAILDFEHAPVASRLLCADLGDVPVLGLCGARFDARKEPGRVAACPNIKAWLRVPFDGAAAEARIRESLAGTQPPDAPAVSGENGAARVEAAPQHEDASAALQALAALLRPGRDAAALPALLQRAMHVLGMDTMLLAVPGEGAATPVALARADNLAVAGQHDLLEEPFVRRALEGGALIGAGGPLPPALAGFARATGCQRCAALPLVDASDNVLGVLACAARRADVPPPALLASMLEIVAAHLAMLLELRAERSRDRERVLTDALTGLANRLLFHDRLESALHDARRTGELFAVLFVDLDRFKGINDSLGHDVGDQVLVAVAERLRGLVRASDTIARYAGDEFTIILRHVNSRADVARVAAKLLAGMQAPLTLGNGSELHVTTSIGVSVYPDDATDSDGLLKHADMAMYSAKGEGRNNVQAFGNGAGETHRQHLEMEARLREAEANGELGVHYQPQVDLASGDVLAVEALVRWQHPVLGMLSPGFFVPLAEETGLIIPIGEWVLRQACSDAAAWRRSSGQPLRLAVNLSALQWMQPNLVAMIRSACLDAGLPPDALDLETPEGVLVNPQPELTASLRALRRMGCRIAIDDCGVAQSAPGQVPRLPVDTVKIDHGFIRNIGTDPDDEAMVAAILATARRRRLHSVAEGVESARQLGFLREHGCDAAQGYLFCRPLPAAAMARRFAGPVASAQATTTTPVSPVPLHGAVAARPRPRKPGGRA